MVDVRRLAVLYIRACEGFLQFSENAVDGCAGAGGDSEDQPSL